MFCKHEIAKLLPKHIARIAKVSLSNWKLIFEEYLLDKASLKILTLPTHLSQVVSTIVTACSMACQLTSLISYRGSKMLPLG